jgi:GT2 family glycosyltransferase
MNERSERLKSAIRRFPLFPRALVERVSAARARAAKVRADVAVIRASGLFDEAWYRAQYPDAAGDPIRHYVERGAAEGRDPNRQFSTKVYLENYPDVAARGANALAHYVAFGRREGRSANQGSYRDWVSYNDTLSEDDRTAFRAAIEAFPARPLISIVMPVYNTELAWLERAIASVRAQLYPNWELCISDDASPNPEVRQLLQRQAAGDPRIRVVYRDSNGHISANSNTALSLATGDYVALMDDDDELAEHALFWVAREILLHPQADLIYSDEDKLDENGRRFAPYFKPDWNEALILAQNFFSHIGVYRRSLLTRVGGFRVGYEGSQDHDLVLRCAELSAPERIRHIPRVLYHWRARAGSTATDVETKPYARKAGVRALQDALERRGIAATVTLPRENYYQVDYQLPPQPPRVSILIPTTAKEQLIGTCVESLLKVTSYPDFEVLIAVSKSNRALPERARLLDRLARDARVRVLAYDDRPFNYSWVNNWMAGQSSAPAICLLNDDVEIVQADWLDRLVARLQLDRVGAVGPMLYYPDDTIQHAGVILGMGGVAGHQFSRVMRGTTGYFGRAMLEQDLSCVTAACMLARRSVFEQLGGFNEDFPVAFNDVDLCLRMRAAGWRIIWTPTVELYHHESASLGRHDSSARRQQFAKDEAMMRQVWDAAIENDPFFNPNLSRSTGNHDLAFPPRVDKLPPRVLARAPGSGH